MVRQVNGTYLLDRWASGTPSDGEDTMKFANLFGIKSVNEVFPASKVTKPAGLVKAMCFKCEFLERKLVV